MLSPSHDHFVARFITDTRRNGGIAHDTHLGIHTQAWMMVQQTGTDVRILSCDRHGKILEELTIISANI